MAKRAFKGGLALALVFALICGAAAMAETLDEFCEGYNEFLPECFAALEMDEETANKLTDMLSVSYSEGSTQDLALPTYESGSGLVKIAFLDEDDPYAGFSLNIIGDEDNDLMVPTIFFLAYFTIRLNAKDVEAVEDLVEWLISSNAGVGKDFKGYNVSYTRTEHFMVISFLRN